MSVAARCASALAAAALVLGLALAAAAPAGAATTWLCAPDRPGNPCLGDLTTRVVDASGNARVERIAPGARPPVDCFYVYPTVTRQSGLNASLVVEPEQTGVARFQAAPFSQACRVFAPLYRQMTVRGLGAATSDRGPFRTAYADVRAAWREYLERHNRGRGVVLIGHSQGAGMLTALIRGEIDREPGVRGRLVSALLIGGNVRVPPRRDVGGDFSAVRACRSPTQLGCVVAYSAYDAPPPADASFTKAENALSRIVGAPSGRGWRVLCTNPAALGGGRAALTTISSGGPEAPYTTAPGLYRGECRDRGDRNWLAVDVAAGDGRQDLRFPVTTGVTLTTGAATGLHLFDVNIALGDLVGLVRSQSFAYVLRASR